MTNDFLHRFVHALDQGELRCCHMALSADVSISPNGAGRLQLFETLQAMEQFDNATFLEELKGNPVLGNLSVEKNRLYEKLLNHIKLLHCERKSANDPQKRLEEGRVLLELGLYEEASDVVQKGLKGAVKAEELLLEVALRELLRETHKNLPRQEHEQLITENEYLLETASRKLTRLIAYTQINDRMLDYHQRFRASDAKSVKRGMNELMGRPEMQSLDRADSLPSQIRFLYAVSLYQASKKDHRAALASKKEIVRLWESNPDRISRHPNGYRSAISNLIGLMAITGELEDAPPYLKRMDAIVPTGRRDEIAWFCDVELQHSLYFMNTGRLEEALERESRILSGIGRYRKQLPVSKKLTFLYNLGVTQLMCDNPGRALYHFNRIRQLGLLDVRQDLQGISRLLRLMLLCEKDSGTFTHYLRNSKRFFNKKDRHYQLEEVVCQWLDHHHGLRGTDERKRSFLMLLEPLGSLAKDKVLGAEEMAIWVMAKARGISVRTVFKERLEAAKAVG